LGKTDKRLSAWQLRRARCPSELLLTSRSFECPPRVLVGWRRIAQPHFRPD
jgi:hypothetical protein